MAQGEGEKHRETSKDAIACLPSEKGLLLGPLLPILVCDGQPHAKVVGCACPVQHIKVVACSAQLELSTASIVAFVAKLQILLPIMALGGHARWKGEHKIQVWLKTPDVSAKIFMAVHLLVLSIASNEEGAAFA